MTEGEVKENTQTAKNLKNSENQCNELKNSAKNDFLTLFEISITFHMFLMEQSLTQQRLKPRLPCKVSNHNHNQYLRGDPPPPLYNRKFTFSNSIVS